MLLVILENVNSNLVTVSGGWLQLDKLEERTELAELAELAFLSACSIDSCLSFKGGGKHGLRLAKSLQMGLMAETSPSALVLADCKVIISLSTHHPAFPPELLSPPMSAPPSCHCLVYCHALDSHQLPCPS